VTWMIRFMAFTGKNFPMTDSDSGVASFYSLTVAFSELCLGIRACFPHDCHHRRDVCHPGWCGSPGRFSSIAPSLQARYPTPA
jgi:hypothetical protein